MPRTYSSANVPCVLTCSRANVFCVLTQQWVLVAYVFTCEYSMYNLSLLITWRLKKKECRYANYMQAYKEEIQIKRFLITGTRLFLRNCYVSRKLEVFQKRTKKTKQKNWENVQCILISKLYPDSIVLLFHFHQF